MKNILALTTSLILVGCATVTVPVKQEFPNVPAVLMEPCEPLNTIDQPTVVFSEFMKVVTINYTKEHICAEKVNSWQQWYLDQKKNWDTVNK